MRLTNGALAAFTLFAAGAARAQAGSAGDARQIVQEAFRGEVVYPQERGEVQLTLTPHSTRFRGARESGVEFGAEYGLSSAWQVQLEWGAFSVQAPDVGRSVRGAGDLSVGTKYSWMSIRESGTHLAAGFDVGLPTGDEAKGLGEGRTSFEPFVVGARDLSGFGSAQIFTGVTASFAAAGDDDADVPGEASKTMEWNTGLLIPVRRVVVTAELTLGSSTSGATAVAFTPGLVGRIAAFDVGIGLPIGVRGPRNAGIVTYLIYEFGGRD